MARKFAALVATLALCATALLGGAGAASAAPVQANPYVTCNGDFGEGNTGFYLPGATDTCTVYGYVSRGLPLVSATLYPLSDGPAAKSSAVRSSLSPFAPAGVRIGNGIFNAKGTGTVRITIPKNTVPGYYYIVFTNYFDKTQVAYEYAFVYSGTLVF